MIVQSEIRITAESIKKMVHLLKVEQRSIFMKMEEKTGTVRAYTMTFAKDGALLKVHINKDNLFERLAQQWLVSSRI